MAQFDLYRNCDQLSKRSYPFLLDVQTNLLEHLNSRMVIPLTRLEHSSASFPKNLCPTLTIDAQDYALLTYQMAAVSVRSLTDLHSSMAASRAEIISALDFLVTGI